MIRSEDGRPLVTDFGIAKRIGSDDGSITRSGMAMGTPRYMAPEQMRDASAVGTPADIFSLGVMLYELMSDKRPFEADSLADRHRVILSGEYIPLNEHAPQLSERFTTTVVACLHGDPAKRLGSCTELLATLDGEPFEPADVPDLAATWEPEPGVPTEALAVPEQSQIALRGKRAGAPIVALAWVMLVGPVAAVFGARRTTGTALPVRYGDRPAKRRFSRANVDSNAAGHSVVCVPLLRLLDVPNGDDVSDHIATHWRPVAIGFHDGRTAHDRSGGSGRQPVDRVYRPDSRAAVDPVRQTVAKTTVP